MLIPRAMLYKNVYKLNNYVVEGISNLLFFVILVSRYAGGDTETSHSLVHESTVT